MVKFREGDTVFIDYNPEIPDRVCHQYYKVKTVLKNSIYSFTISSKVDLYDWFVRAEWVDHIKGEVPEEYMEKVVQLVGC
jgi:ribosomal protein L21E